MTTRINRRLVLAGMAGLVGSTALPRRSIAAKGHGNQGADYDWRQAAPRSRYVWENHEEIFYHDLSYEDPELNSAPEYAAFSRRSWVFNRALAWRTDAAGSVLCHGQGGDVPLTGEHQASRWLSDPRNLIESVGEATRFRKRAPARYRDCAVIPAFQFHTGQHPVLEIEVSDASTDWQFCVSIKGRAGPPLLDSG